MELTRSFERVIPATIRDRYDFRETRNAAAVLTKSNPVAFGERRRLGVDDRGGEG